MVSTTPSNGATQAELFGVEINFAHPMDEESVEDAIVVSPEPEETDYVYTYWDESSVRLNLYFPQENSTAYTVTIPAGVKDRYGQAMAQDFVLSFSTRPREPGTVHHQALGSGHPQRLRRPTGGGSLLEPPSPRFRALHAGQADPHGLRDRLGQIREPPPTGERAGEGVVAGHARLRAQRERPQHRHA